MTPDGGQYNPTTSVTSTSEITTLWHYRNVTIAMIMITSQSYYNITGMESGCA